MDEHGKNPPELGLRLRAAAAVFGFAAWFAFSVFAAGFSWEELQAWQWIVATAAGYGLLTVLAMSGLVRAARAILTTPTARASLFVRLSPRRATASCLGVGLIVWTAWPNPWTGLWLGVGTGLCSLLGLFLVGSHGSPWRRTGRRPIRGAATAD